MFFAFDLAACSPRRHFCNVVPYRIARRRIARRRGNVDRRSGAAEGREGRRVIISLCCNALQ